MKNKLLKLIALIMCIVITCLTLSVGSMAASGKVHKIDKLDGFYIDCVETNESGTIALLVSRYNEEYRCAFTKNGTEYTILNFDKYLPNGCDKIQIYNYATKEDLFVFLLYAYKTETVKEEYYDENEDEYYYGEYETDVLSQRIIITTKDFVTYNKFNVNLPDVAGIDELYYAFYFSAFDFVGDNLIFYDANYKNTSGTNGVGVYYSTKDFKNWNVHYTPECQLKNANDYYYGDFRFDVQDDTLIVKFAYDSEGRETIYEKAFATNNFKDYISVYDKSNVNGDASSAEFKYFIDNNLCYRLELYYILTSGGKYKIEVDWTKIDLNTGKEEKLLSAKNIFYWRYSINDNGKICFATEDSNGKVSAYTYEKNSNEFVSKTIDYKLSESVFYSNNGSVMFFYNKGNLCISETWNLFDYKKYNISSIGFDAESMEPFILNNKVFLLENKIVFKNDDYIYKTRVAETDIVLNQTKIGDLNNDSKINSSDALLTLQAATGIVNLTQEQRSFADVNKDSKVNSQDALLILQFATNLIQSFK